jgi:hypothetical protein
MAASKRPCGFDTKGRWQSGFLAYKFHQATLEYIPVNVGGYFTLSARIGYRLTDFLKIAATVQQLSQPRIQETSSTRL